MRQRLDPVDPDSKDSDAAGNAASAVPLILADVSNDASLNEMCKQATVIINCVGPVRAAPSAIVITDLLLPSCASTHAPRNSVDCSQFRFFGEQVVRACVTQGTHYVDITGEPEVLVTQRGAGRADDDAVTDSDTCCNARAVHRAHDGQVPSTGCGAARAHRAVLRLRLDPCGLRGHIRAAAVQAGMV